MSTWIETVTTSVRVGWKTHVVSRSLTWPERRVSVRTVGYGLLVLQGIAFIIFSLFEWHRFALTSDFSSYYQPWYLIAHGHLNPPQTADGVQFYQDHFVLAIWVLAPLYWLWPHAITLLWVQDLAAIGAELVAWNLMIAMVTEKISDARIQRVLLLTGVVLLVANPWSYWGIAFDFHPYTLGVFCAVLALRYFLTKRIAFGYLCSALVFFGGDVVATYIAGLGISVIILSKGRTRWHGAILLGGMVGLLGVYSLITSAEGGVPHSLTHVTHATNIGFLAPYSYIAGSQTLSITHLIDGFFFHPNRWIPGVWALRTDVWAVLSPGGLLGIFTGYGIGMPLVALVQTFLAPGFNTDFAQMFPIFALLAVGTMQWLVRIAARRKILGSVLALLLMTNSVGWGVVWISRWPHQWVSVTASAALVLRKIESSIPSHNEVVASQGIMGRFSNRQWVYPLLYPTLPTATPVTDIIISPYQGINVLTTNQILSRVAYLSANPHARLLLHQDGIWLFAYRHPAHSLSLTFPSTTNTVPGWASGTAEGQPLLNGPSEDWTMTSGQTAGYVMDQAYWRLPRGTYQVSVRLEDTGPVNVEVWNATASHLLLRRTMPVTNGIEVQTATFVNAKHYPSHLYRGVGPFALDPNPSSPYNAIEVRVWTPGGETVNVYQVWITEISHHF